MHPRLPALLAALSALSGIAACSLDVGGLGGADAVDGDAERFEDDAVDVDDAAPDRDDAAASDGTPPDGDVPVDSDADRFEGTDDAEDAGELDTVPEVVDDAGPDLPEDGGDDADDVGPEDVPLACDAGLTWCAGVCVDTTSDPSHCGGCDVPCASGPHAAAACAGSACGLACEAGWGDCDGEATDGCEVDLTAALEDCGACGNGCAAPAHGAARCTAGSCGFDCETGFVLLDGACVAFGGAYLFAECGGGVCRNPNPATGACSCPPGFTASPASRIVNDCTGGAYVWANLYFCSAPSFAAGSDWGGAYYLYDSGTCAVGNPYTGRCTCPAGTAPISWRVEHGSMRLASVGLCWSPTAVEQTFAGAFEVGDVGSPCLVANPETGACSCPSGAVRSNYRGIYPHGAPYGEWGTQMAICYR
jgi:hypothetical protein